MLTASSAAFYSFDSRRCVREGVKPLNENTDDNQSFSWSRIPHFRLPLPTWIAAASTLLPVISVIFLSSLQILLNRYLTSSHGAIRPYIDILSSIPFYILVGIILGVASGHVSTSAILRCQMETQWTRFFRAHNQEAIRGIQSALQCCGYNSIYDRAWPFPGHGVDADACVRSLGFHRRCADVWMQQQLTAGRLTITSGVGSIVLIVRMIPFPHATYVRLIFL